MKKSTLEKKVDLLLDAVAKFADAAHRHNEAFRDAISNLADVMHAKDDHLASMVGKLLALYTDHNKVVEETVDAIAEDVETFDKNLHTMNANAEQRFNAMHLEHDLIIDMLSRIHGIDGGPNEKKSSK